MPIGEKFMEFYEVIKKRKTIREFSSQTVPKDKIFKIIEAGLKAPAYNHLREWDFIFINQETVRLNIIATEKIPDSYQIDELHKVFEGHDTVAKEMYIDALPKQKKMILTAPEVLVVVYKPKTQVADSKRVYDLNGLASIWCCIENILLAMAEENLVGVTFVPQHTDKLKTILGVPSELEIASIIPFGYRAETARLLKQKKINLHDRIHYNIW
jgi:nitroreductase